jgi:7-cyano-7-deazaguanine synthase
MMRKAFVLLSGGLDSTTYLYQAILDYSPYSPEKTFAIIDHNTESETYEDKDHIDWVEAVSINYGQRHSKELRMAALSCELLGIRHSVISLANLLASDTTMLTNKDIEIPNVDYADLPQGVSPTYVPFRNGTMLSVLTAHAQKWVNQATEKHKFDLETRLLGDPRMIPDEGPPTAGIYFGAHAEDAHNWAYPDCTPEFIGAMANAIYIGSYMKIRLHAPLMNMIKAEIVVRGSDLGVPFQNTWSCYKGEDKHCGICPTCRSRRSAFKMTGIQDPTEYVNELPIAAE